MYRVIEKTITKLAGTAVSKNQKQWPAEVLKAVVSQHPYIDTRNIKMEFTHHDAEQKLTIGKLIANQSVAIPFTIRENPKTKKMEIDPIDIMYDGESFKALNEQSFSEATHSGVGRVERKTDKVPAGNRYIGDQTGDVTPLEWSYYPSGLGSGARTAGSGLLSYVVKNQDDIDRLLNVVNTYSGINSAAQLLGLDDSLENLRYGLVEGTEPPKLIHVMKRQGGGFAISFDDGDARAISTEDLKVALQNDFVPVMRHVLKNGWCVIRDFPTMKSVDVRPLQGLGMPVREGGAYLLFRPDGTKAPGLVFNQIIDFDGEVIKQQKALLFGTCEYALGKRFSGIRMPYDSMDLPVSTIDVEKKGFLVDESWGGLQATPNITIKAIIDMPDGMRIITAENEYTGELIGLVPVPDMVRPQRMSAYRIQEYVDVLPHKSYYIPGHMSFVEVSGHAVLGDKAQVMDSPVARIQKNAGLYSFFGETNSGQVNMNNLPEDVLIQKLAQYGADDVAIQRVLNLSDREEQELYGLQNMLEKEASLPPEKLNVELGYLKMAAEEALKAVDESDDAAQDPQILDAVLSLQMVSEENLRELLGSKELFIEVEDKLARMLLAARQGERSINEKGIARALKGIGQARKSLKTLAIELDDRE